MNDVPRPVKDPQTFMKDGHQRPPFHSLFYPLLSTFHSWIFSRIDNVKYELCWASYEQHVSWLFNCFQPFYWPLLHRPNLGLDRKFLNSTSFIRVLISYLKLYRLYRIRTLLNKQQSTFSVTWWWCFTLFKFNALTKSSSSSLSFQFRYYPILIGTLLLFLFQNIFMIYGKFHHFHGPATVDPIGIRKTETAVLTLLLICYQ